MMETERFSLMAFPFAVDQAMKKMTTADMYNLAAEYGISSFDLMNPTPEQAAEHAALCKKYGMKICCYIASVSFFKTKQEVTDTIRRHLDAAEALGAQLLMIVPFDGPMDFRTAKRIGKKRTADRMIQGFRLAVRLARHRKMQVCFETTPHEIFAMSGTKDCAYVLDHVPGLGLVFDTANMLPHGDDTLSAYERLKERIVYVHLKDVSLSLPKRHFFPLQEHTKDNRCMSCVLWGQGVIPVRELYGRMLSDGYQGNFAIEYAHPPKTPCGMKAHEQQLGRFLKYLA